MRPILKNSLFAVTICAVVAGVLWMRALVSWRPVKIGQVHQQYNVDFLSADGKVALLGGMDGSGLAVDLEKDNTAKWGAIFNETRTFSETSPEYVAVINQQGNTGELKVRYIHSGEDKPPCFLPSGTSVSPSYILPQPDGKTIGTVQVLSPAKLNLLQWNIADGKLTRRVVLKSPFAFSEDATSAFGVTSDGKRLIGCTEGKGAVWDIASGQMIRQWKVAPLSYLAVLSPDARLSVYSFHPMTGAVPTYAVVDTSNGKTLWQTKDELFLIKGDEIFFPHKNNCDILDVWTGRRKRQLPGPRDSDGILVRIVDDYIYTQSGKNEIYRWRAR